MKSESHNVASREYVRWNILADIENNPDSFVAQHLSIFQIIDVCAAQARMRDLQSAS